MPNKEIILLTHEDIISNDLPNIVELVELAPGCLLGHLEFGDGTTCWRAVKDSFVSDFKETAFNDMAHFKQIMKVVWKCRHRHKQYAGLT